MRRRKVALLGASGWIGQHFARLLADHPFFEDPILSAGPKSVGKLLEDVWLLPEEGPPPSLTARTLVHTTPETLESEGVEVVFSALPSDEAGPLETELARRGMAVFSNASAHRMDRDVPLVIPEVNGDHLNLLKNRGKKGFIVTNSNCSTAGLVVALKPLLPLLKPREVTVTTYQALSGAGYPGVPSLASLDNILPYIPDEETKLGLEASKMFGSLQNGAITPLELPVYANCARVGTREGHLEAVVVDSKSEVSVDSVCAAWAGFRPMADVREGTLPTAPESPVIYRTELNRPQPLLDRWAGTPVRAKGMAVTVGRLRVQNRKILFYLLVHNAVRGGAGGSVLNAELALRKGLLGD